MNYGKLLIITIPIAIVLVLSMIYLIKWTNINVDENSMSTSNIFNLSGIRDEEVRIGDVLVNDSKVFVKGIGIASVKSDRYVLTIIVKNPRPTLEIEDEYKIVIEKVNRLVEILKENSLEVETVDFRIYPHYSYPGSILDGYFIEYKLTAYTDNLDKIEIIIPYLVDKYVIINLDLIADRSTILAAKNEALRLAIENAFSKIETIKSILNASKIKILRIVVEPYELRYAYTTIRKFALTEVSLPAPVLIPRKIEVVATVEIECELIQ